MKKPKIILDEKEKKDLHKIKLKTHRHHHTHRHTEIETEQTSKDAELAQVNKTIRNSLRSKESVIEFCR